MASHKLELEQRTDEVSRLRIRRDLDADIGKLVSQITEESKKELEMRAALQAAQKELQGIDKKSLDELKQEKEKELLDLKREQERVRRKEEMIESELLQLGAKAVDQLADSNIRNIIKGDTSLDFKKGLLGLEYGEKLATLSQRKAALLQEKFQIENKLGNSNSTGEKAAPGSHRDAAALIMKLRQNLEHDQRNLDQKKKQLSLEADESKSSFRLLTAEDWEEAAIPPARAGRVANDVVTDPQTLQRYKLQDAAKKFSAVNSSVVPPPAAKPHIEAPAMSPAPPPKSSHSNRLEPSGDVPGKVSAPKSEARDRGIQNQNQDADIEGEISHLKQEYLHSGGANPQLLEAISELEREVIHFRGGKKGQALTLQFPQSQKVATPVLTHSPSMLPALPQVVMHPALLAANPLLAQLHAKIVENDKAISDQEAETEKLRREMRSVAGKKKDKDSRLSSLLQKAENLLEAKGNGDKGPADTRASDTREVSGKPSVFHDIVEEERELADLEREMERQLYDIRERGDDAEVERLNKLFDLRKSHLTQMLSLKYEMQKMEQETALAKMRDEVDRLRKQHQQEEYEFALQQELIEAKYRRQLAKESVIDSDLHSSIFWAPNGDNYDPAAGFTLFFDWATGLGVKVLQCSVVYAFFDGKSACTDARMLSLCDTEPQPNTLLLQSIIAQKRQFSKIAQKESLRAIIEIQSVASGVSSSVSSKLNSTAIGWTVIPLFTDKASFLNAGIWRVPLLHPPMRMDLTSEELLKMPVITRSEIFLRLVKNTEANAHLSVPVDPDSITHRYNVAPWLKSSRGADGDVVAPPPSINRRRIPEEHPRAGSFVRREPTPAPNNRFDQMRQSSQLNLPSVPPPLAAPATVPISITIISASGFVSASETSLLVAHVCLISHRGFGDVVKNKIRDESGQDLSLPETWKWTPTSQRVAPSGLISWPLNTRIAVFHSPVDTRPAVVLEIFSQGKGEERYVGWGSIPVFQERLSFGSLVIAKLIARGLKSRKRHLPSPSFAPTLQRWVVNSFQNYGDKYPTPQLSPPQPKYGKHAVYLFAQRRTSPISFDDAEPTDPPVTLTLVIAPAASQRPPRGTDDDRPMAPAPRQTPPPGKKIQRKNVLESEEGDDTDATPVFISNPQAPLSRSPFSAGDGFDLYIDQIRFLPDNATVSRVAAFLSRAPLSQGSVFGKLEVDSFVGSRDMKSPMIRGRKELRVANDTEIFDPTSTVVFTVTTRDKINSKLCVVGFGILNIFVDLATGLQPSYGASEFVLNLGSFQIPIHRGGLDPKREFNCEGLAMHAVAPATTILVRILPAPRSDDGRSVLSAETTVMGERELEQIGLVVPPPGYLQGKYDTTRCEPTELHQIVYDSLKTRTRCRIVDALVQADPKLQDESLETKTPLQLQEFVRSVLTPSPQTQPSPIDPRFHTPFSPLVGLSFVLEDCINLPKNSCLHFALLTLPPFSYYASNGDLSAGTQVQWEVDPLSDQRAPRFRDKPFTIKDLQWAEDRLVTLIVDIRCLVTHSGGLFNRKLAVPIVESVGFGLIPVLGSKGPYVLSGRYRIPLFRGSPPRDLIDQIKATAATSVMNTAMREGRIERLRWASALVKIDDGLHSAAEVQSALQKPPQSAYLRDLYFSADESPEYDSVKSSAQVAKLIKNESLTESAVTFCKLAKLTPPQSLSSPAQNL